MAQVRNVSGESRQVPELGGFGGGREVIDQEVVDVPDDRYEGYVCQPDVWEPVNPPEVEVEDPTTAAVEDRAPADTTAPVEPPAETTPEPAAAAGGDTPTPPLYEHQGDGDIDAAAWPLADVTTPDGIPLYRFTGDTGADATGGSDIWHVYDGPTAPAIAKENS